MNGEGLYAEIRSLEQKLDAGGSAPTTLARALLVYGREFLDCGLLPEARRVVSVARQFFAAKGGGGGREAVPFEGVRERLLAAGVKEFRHRVQASDLSPWEVEYFQGECEGLLRSHSRDPHGDAPAWLRLCALRDRLSHKRLLRCSPNGGAMRRSAPAGEVGPYNRQENVRDFLFESRRHSPFWAQELEALYAELQSWRDRVA